MQVTQCVVILDFGGQYTQLIARRVRENNVYSEVVPYTATLRQIQDLKPVGIILSGGPASVLDEDAPSCDKGIFELGVPVLGICYGMQLMAVLLDGRVTRPDQREYGRTQVTMDKRDGLFAKASPASSCWLSHTYQVSKMPEGFIATAHSDNCPIAAMEHTGKKLFGVQFHPEVTHTQEGSIILKNFLKDICGCVGDWSMEAYAQMAVRRIRDQVGEHGTVLLGLSGGVDSSVAAALLYEAIGDRLTCVFVDHGFLRKAEAEQVDRCSARLSPCILCTWTPASGSLGI
jgi:GMP synthase (glutamine-hydrolysing)